MSDWAIYVIPALFVIAGVGIIAWAAFLEWRADKADDAPPGDHSHYEDSIQNARRANGRDAT